MKKQLTIITVIAILICCLSSCGKSDYVRDQEAKEEAIYQRGYAAGYRAAMDEAPEKIEFYVKEDLQKLEWDIEDTEGMDAEEAVLILSNYADGERVSKEDLIDAILAIRKYYWGVHEIANDINNHWID